MTATMTVASSAQAEEPDPLALTATNPPSSQSQPAQSTTPLLKGRGDGDITTVVGGGSEDGFLIPTAIDDDNPVEIYANGTCAGTADWTGTVNELEGAGIAVEAAVDAPTTYSAIRIDPDDEAHPSPCSNAFTYWHSTTPVTPPPGEDPGNGESSGGGTTAPGGSNGPPSPRLRTIPGGRANDNTPLVTGSAPDAATVRVFSTPDCSGGVVAKGSVAELAAGLRIQVPDNSVTSFSAVSAAGGSESACSAPVTYVEDSAAPRTRITMGPGIKTRRRKAVFRFADISGDPPGTTFLCKVDRKKWKQCTSPFRLKRLGFRRHLLRVRAIDLAGNAEAKGAKRSFKVVRAP